MSRIVGGIEGGSTHSRIVLLDENGKTLACESSLGTNHHLLGLDGCRKRIAELVDKAKILAKIPLDVPLLALGLSLSGCEQDETNETLVDGLRKKYPHLSEKYAIGSDTLGSVAACSNKGGIVSIVGTGSNVLLINPDGTKVQCGGWGYILGDEASAYHMAFTAIKTCFDALDNFEKPPHPIETVWSEIQQFFHIKTQPDLLSAFYLDFDKARIAAFCKELSRLAFEGEALAKHLFYRAGSQIAQAITAVYPRASSDLTDREGGLHVSCVGSVWLSWELLEPGFKEWLDKNGTIKELCLAKVTSNGGLGAAYMACDKLNIDVPRHYSDNYEVFYRYQGSKLANGTCPCTPCPNS